MNGTGSLTPGDTVHPRAAQDVRNRLAACHLHRDVLGKNASAADESDLVSRAGHRLHLRQAPRNLHDIARSERHVRTTRGGRPNSDPLSNSTATLFDSCPR